MVRMDAELKEQIEQHVEQANEFDSLGGYGRYLFREDIQANVESLEVIDE